MSVSILMTRPVARSTDTSYSVAPLVILTFQTWRLASSSVSTFVTRPPLVRASAIAEARSLVMAAADVDAGAGVVEEAVAAAGVRGC